MAGGTPSRGHAVTRGESECRLPRTRSPPHTDRSRRTHMTTMTTTMTDGDVTLMDRRAVAAKATGKQWFIDIGPYMRRPA